MLLFCQRFDRNRDGLGISTRFGEAGSCPAAGSVRQSSTMPDRPFPAVDNLIRRAQRLAAGRPNPARILAQTISLACPGGADPYAVLGVLVEGTVQTLITFRRRDRRKSLTHLIHRIAGIR